MMILLLMIALITYWVTPLVLLVIGLTRLRSRPENAKKLLIGAAVMLVVGIGFCGMLLMG